MYTRWHKKITHLCSAMTFRKCLWNSPFYTQQMLPAGDTVAMTVIKLYLLLTGCRAYSSPEGRHKQCRDSRKASGYNSATAPSSVFQLPITKPYSTSSSSSNLNTPLCGSCRFHGTYLNKKSQRAKTDLKKNNNNNLYSNTVSRRVNLTAVCSGLEAH